MRFITCDKYQNYCVLYTKAWQPSFDVGRIIHSNVFIYKAILLKLPSYIITLLLWKASTAYNIQTIQLLLSIYCTSVSFWPPHILTETWACFFYLRHKLNKAFFFTNLNIYLFIFIYIYIFYYLFILFYSDETDHHLMTRSYKRFLMCF